MPPRAARVPDDAHEWVSFDDPDEDRTWLFDTTFLLSGWTCIYGRGCEGVLTGPAADLDQGCCSYGAHFTGPEDAARVAEIARSLGPDVWQFRGRARKGVVKSLPDGDLVTRLVDGACIFLNRPGFPGGAGCALHHAAARAGRSHVETKPEVCWQLPLRREDETAPDGRVTSVVRQWDRRHWGAGGGDFHWWCTEAPEAFRGASPVYRTMRTELEAMAGPSVYRLLAAYLDARFFPEPEGRGTARRTPVVVATPLPHPAVRRRA
ncbi:MAG: hypothetical protein M0029_03945 [Actinomycetota bacterium]|nr:hypothetical protein [Actinomycetota bacterium]